MRRQIPAELLVLLAVLFWSVNFSVVKFGVGRLEPLTYSAVRFSIGGLAMLAFLRWKEGSVGVRREDLRLLVPAALFGITLNQLCFVFAVSNTTAANTALLLSTAPIFTALVVGALGLERVGIRGWFSVAIGMAGVVLIVEGAGSQSSGGQSLLGDVLALGTAVTWAAYTLLIRPLMHRYSAYRLSTFMMVVGTAMLWPVALPSVLRQDFGAVEPAAWGAIAYSTLFAVLITNVLYFNAIHRLGSARASLFLYLESFGGVLFAGLLLHEQVTLAQLIGGVVVTAAVVAGRARPRIAAGVAVGEELEVIEPVV